MTTTKALVVPIAGRIATAKNDITIPNYTRVLRPQDETLIAKGGMKGIGLYREVLKDGRAFTVLQKRKRKLVSRNWRLEPASPARVDRKAAKLCEAQLGAIALDRIALGFLDATLMGYAVGEVEWERRGDEIAVKDVLTHDQRRFVFDRDRNPRLLTWDAMVEGEELPARKFIVHRFEDLTSDPYGWGLGRVLFWHVLFKREGVAFWMRALERFATPIPVAKYAEGSTPAQIDRILDGLSGSIVEGAIAVPIGTEISFATSAVSGTLTHEAWCNYWDDATAELVLGQNLSTNIGDVGSKAAASSHKATEEELIDGDADLLGATLRMQLLDWICAYNVPDAQPPLLIWDRPRNQQDEEEAASARADRRTRDLANLRALKAQGWAPADEKAAVEAIMDGPVVAVTPVADPLPSPTPAAIPAMGAEFAAAAADLSDDVDVIADAAQPVFESWVAAVRKEAQALLREGGSLADLPGRMLARYPALKLDQLTAILAAGLANADARGRAEVADGD